MISPDSATQRLYPPPRPSTEALLLHHFTHTSDLLNFKYLSSKLCVDSVEINTVDVKNDLNLSYHHPACTIGLPQNQDRAEPTSPNSPPSSKETTPWIHASRSTTDSPGTTHLHHHILQDLGSAYIGTHYLLQGLHPAEASGCISCLNTVSLVCSN